MNKYTYKWFLLDPNDFQSKWWKNNEIVDPNKFNDNKELKDILAVYIIQDGNMGGNYWYVSKWYSNDPNRYNRILFQNNWPFNKELTQMKPGDIIYLLDNSDIKFNVYYSNFALPNQKKFCKILQRINCN